MGGRFWKQLHISSTHLQKPETSEANRDLLKAVDRELMFVQKGVQKLPKVTSFECSIEDAMATLRRTVQNEEVTVSLDANSGVEMDLLDGELSGSDVERDTEANMEDEDDSTRVPAFTVTVSKPSGNKMQFECSFHPGVNELEELSIMIDSVAVIPKDCSSVESIYTVDTDQLGKDLYDGLESYLAERGINRTFGSDLLNFYAMFEDRAYTTDFLERMKKYCLEQ